VLGRVPDRFEKTSWLHQDGFPRPIDDGFYNGNRPFVFFLGNRFGNAWITGNNCEAGQTPCFPDSLWNGCPTLFDKA